LHVSEGGCDVKASKHRASLLTTDWNASGNQVVQPSLFVFIILVLSYPFVLPTSVLRIPKTHNRISYRYDMQMYCTFVLFVNQHFSGLPASETHCTSNCREVLYLFPVQHTDERRVHPACRLAAHQVGCETDHSSPSGGKVMDPYHCAMHAFLVCTCILHERGAVPWVKLLSFIDFALVLSERT
jgi:hypothetical protein